MNLLHGREILLGFLLLFLFNAVTGQTECGFPGGTCGSLLLAVKAHESDSIEVVDMGDPGVTCDDIPLPQELARGNVVGRSLHATFVGGRLLVCGVAAGDCYLYDDASGSWSPGPSRGSDRAYPYGLDMDGGHWVSGGVGAEDPESLRTSEVFDGEGFSDSVDLPFFAEGHCAARVGENQAMVMGGSLGRNVTILDTVTGEIIRDAAPLPVGNSRNIDGICGTATRADGGMVVVYAGGVYRPTAAPITLYQFAQQESFIYDVEGDIWTPGPFFPSFGRALGRAVPYGDSFLVVGGAFHIYPELPLQPPPHDAAYPREILRFDPASEGWEEEERGLREGDIVTAAPMAPEGFAASCSSN